MKRQHLPVRSLCGSIFIGGLVALSGACGGSPPAPNPLLVPWEQLTGRIAYVRGTQEIFVIDSVRREVRLVYTIHPDFWIRDVTWHPSGTSLTVTMFQVYPAQVWSLASIDVGTGNRTNLYPAMIDPSYADWSKDGRVAFKAGGGLFIDGVAFSPGLDAVALSAPSWSPDGSTLAVAVNNPSAFHGSGDLTLVNVATGTASPLGPADCSEPKFSPDGTRIAYTFIPVATPSEQLRIARVPGGAETHLSGADSIVPSHPAWSPDGARLVAQSNTDLNHPKLYLVDATTGATTPLIASDGHSPAWSP
jgi:WD40 repeat protein